MQQNCDIICQKNAKDCCGHYVFVKPHFQQFKLLLGVEREIMVVVVAYYHFFCLTKTKIGVNNSSK